MHGSGDSALEPGKSEKEWTSECEGLEERSNCSFLPHTMVNWTSGMTGRAAEAICRTIQEEGRH